MAATLPFLPMGLLAAAKLIPCRYATIKRRVPFVFAEILFG